MSTETITMPASIKPLLKENVRALIDHIERAGLLPGARLESERELAKILEISRPSLREAIQVLQAQGRILVKHGVGVFVLDDATGERFKGAYLSQRANIEELFQMREILEAPAVEWAAERHTSEQLAEMNQALLRLSEALTENPVDFEKVRELDMDFHLVIVRSASNRFLNQTLGTLQEIMRNSMENTLKLPGRIDESEAEHRIILEAIANRDPIKARLMIIQHIHNARDAWAKFLKKEHGR
ncbi:MAG: FadR family transcriptional regulator [Actinobacteria bacterium]|nr:FadR family transcriptional regulator [Actinomycetota bacterium]